MPDLMSTTTGENSERPFWMTAAAGLCALTLFVAILRDLFIAGPRETEVWFGFELHGLAAMLTAPLHWLIFATGAWAFWTRKPWAALAGACYLFYAAGAHLIWSEVSINGRGWMVGLLQACAISGFGYTLLRLGKEQRSSADI